MTRLKAILRDARHIELQDAVDLPDGAVVYIQIELESRKERYSRRMQEYAASRTEAVAREERETAESLMAIDAVLEDEEEWCAPVEGEK
jgi:hypothetical protein